MSEIIDNDGLLSVKGVPDGSLSWQADYLARLHPTACATVADFYDLSSRYHEKLIADRFPDIARNRQIERERHATTPPVRS